jgi:ABC-type molybdate transport system ATPase subunit
MFPHINTQQNVPYTMYISERNIFKIIINILVISYHKDTKESTM